MMIKVVRPLSTDDIKAFTPVGMTRHLIEERYSRLSAYRPYLSTNYMYGFEVDNGHPKGNELHFVNDYGIVYIYNKNSKRFITITHPRSKQLMHYFLSTGLDIPPVVHKLALVLDERNRTLNLNDK
jgi:hypothetical protein